MKKVIEPCTDRNCLQTTNIALINMSMKNIEDKVDDIKETLTTFISSADTKYSSKEEFKQNKDRIDKIDDNIKWIVKIVIWTVILAMLSLVVIKFK